MRKRFGAFFAFFLASLVLASLFASPALAGRRVALVIGNSEYEHIGRLENPINDAKDVAETLGKLDLETILVPNADRDRFEQALVEFGSKASGSDLALVYYAGHGVQHGDTNYLLPTDIAGDQGVVEIKAIDMGKVRRQLDKATGVKILILDACRNDPFTENRGFERASIGSEGAAKGMLIAYAAAPGQVAMDGKGRRNSPFVEALVDHLKKAPGVEIRTLFNRVADEVSVKTGGKQEPNINSMIHGNFYFVSPDKMCQRRAPGLPCPAPEPATELHPVGPAPESVTSEMHRHPAPRPFGKDTGWAAPPRPCPPRPRLCADAHSPHSRLPCMTRMVPL
jgi:hypothetical protein